MRMTVETATQETVMSDIDSHWRHPKYIYQIQDYFSKQAIAA